MNSFKSPTLSIPASFDGVFFVTLRLRDALPESFGQSLALQYYSKQLKFAQHPDSIAQLRQARKRLFARYDDALDLEKYGHSYLREPALAKIMADEILRCDGTDYTLLAYCILPNHVHLLLDLRSTLAEDPALDDLESYQYQPLRNIVGKIQHATKAPLKKALQQLGEHIDPRTFQKHSANGSVKMDGKFWHERTFDFRVLDAAEFEKIVQYILYNPVKAELVKDWVDWNFSYWPE
ncbi:MAG: transposase [Saprospiraceae bacterium]